MLDCLGFSTIQNQHQKNYKNYQDNKNFSKFFKKDGQVHSGVLIPDNLLTGDNEKDWCFAKRFLSEKNEWLRIKSGKIINGHTGFGFRALAIDEKLTEELVSK